MAVVIGIGIAIAALVVAILAIVYTRSLGGQQIKLAAEQVRLAEQQIDADNARRAWEIEQAKRADRPIISIEPTHVANTSSPYDFNVALANRSTTITARGVVLIGILDNKEIAERAGPADIQPNGRVFGTITFDFSGTPDELWKAAGFRAVDHDGNEWTWHPTAT